MKYKINQILIGAVNYESESFDVSNTSLVFTDILE